MKLLVNQRYKNLFTAQVFNVKAFVKFIHFLFFFSFPSGQAGHLHCRPSLWSDVETKTVDKLPFDIDGLAKYHLIFDKERCMESSRDGRPWAGFMTS